MSANRPFDASKFLERLNRGEFDGRVTEEIRKLTPEQLEQVALLRAQQLKKRKGKSDALVVPA